MSIFVVVLIGDDEDGMAAVVGIAIPSVVCWVMMCIRCEDKPKTNSAFVAADLLSSKRTNR